MTFVYGPGSGKTRVGAVNAGRGCERGQTPRTRVGVAPVVPGGGSAGAYSSSPVAVRMNPEIMNQPPPTQKTIRSHRGWTG